MPHPHPYASRERDYDPEVGRDIGPWDADAIGDDDIARAAMDDAALDQRLVTVSASIPVDADYEVDALHNDGRVVGVVIRRPRGMYSMVVITAAPRSQRLWADHLVTVDPIHARDAGAVDVELVDGAFGPEMWLVDADGRQTLVHSVDGAGWMLRVTHWVDGAPMTAADVEEAENLTAGIIVARGNAPVLPGHPLDMSVVHSAGGGD